MADDEVTPGERAPACGTYEELNVFGQPTGRRVAVKASEELPPSPRGFHWRRIGGRDA